MESSRKVYLIVFSSYFFSFSNDVCISWTSSVVGQLKSNNSGINPLGAPINENQEFWLENCLSLGYIVGLLPYGYLCFKFGRKPVLISLGCLHLLGFVLFLTGELFCFYVGRFLNGIASGAGFILFPVYIAEICKDSDRGFLIVSRHIFSSFGFIFSCIAGNYLSMFIFNSFLCVFPSLFVISFAYFAVESPYFYVMKNDFAKGKQMLTELYGNREETDEDLDEVKRTVEMTETVNLTESLSYKNVQRAVVLIYVIFIFQHLTGSMPFAEFTQENFENNGMFIVGITLLIGSSIATVLVDKIGRKFLFYISLVGIIIVEITFASFQLFYSSHNYLSIILCLAFYSLLYNLGLAFLPQIICAEILPLSVKFRVASTAGLIGYLSAIILTGFLNFGSGYTILFFAFSSCVYLAIIQYFLPETKGTSFRQIQYLLEIGHEIKV